MRTSLSTAACFMLIGCSMHLGVPPASRLYEAVEVVSTAVEPGLEHMLRAGVLDGLAARDALAGEGEAVAMTVESTTWAPSSRGTASVIYEATLTVRFSSGGRTERFSRSARTNAYASAADAEADRPRLFAGLCEEVAALGVLWLVTG